MRIKVKYIKNREVIRLKKVDNLILSEEAIDNIRRA